MDTDERMATLRLLLLARAYVAKGCEMGAYAGCVTSGDTVLRRLDAGIKGLAQSPEFQAPVVERMEY